MWLQLKEKKKEGTETGGKIEDIYIYLQFNLDQNVVYTIIL